MLRPISMHHEATLHHDVHVCYSALGLFACTKKNCVGWTTLLLLWDCLLAQKQLWWVGTWRIIFVVWRCCFQKRCDRKGVPWTGQPAPCGVLVWKLETRPTGYWVYSSDKRIEERRKKREENKSDALGTLAENGAERKEGTIAENGAEGAYRHIASARLFCIH